jgi:hypothetical protein
MSDDGPLNWMLGAIALCVLIVAMVGIYDYATRGAQLERVSELCQDTCGVNGVALVTRESCQCR